MSSLCELIVITGITLYKSSLLSPPPRLHLSLMEDVRKLCCRSTEASHSHTQFKGHCKTTPNSQYIHTRGHSTKQLSVYRTVDPYLSTPYWLAAGITLGWTKRTIGRGSCCSFVRVTIRKQNIERKMLLFEQDVHEFWFVTPPVHFSLVMFRVVQHVISARRNIAKEKIFHGNSPAKSRIFTVRKMFVVIRPLFHVVGGQRKYPPLVCKKSA